jgi:hypothetical protein
MRRLVPTAVGLAGVAGLVVVVTLALDDPDARPDRTAPDRGWPPLLVPAPDRGPGPRPVPLPPQELPAGPIQLLPPATAPSRAYPLEATSARTTPAS